MTGDEAPRDKEKSLAYSFAVGFFGNTVYEKLKWDFHGVNFEEAMKLADEKTGAVLNAIDPDLRAFHSHGGKLVLYHGWNDPAIPGNKHG